MTTRRELILSKEYVDTYVEHIIRSKRSITDVRKDMNEFILEYRAEYAAQFNADIVLPEYYPPVPENSFNDGVLTGWNACINEIKRLNGL